MDCQYSIQGTYSCKNNVERFENITTVDKITGKWDNNAIIYKTSENHGAGIWIGIYYGRPNFIVHAKSSGEYVFDFPDRKISFIAEVQNNKLVFNSNITWNQLTPLNQLK